MVTGCEAFGKSRQVRGCRKQNLSPIYENEKSVILELSRFWLLQESAEEHWAGGEVLVLVAERPLD